MNRTTIILFLCFLLCVNNLTASSFDKEKLAQALTRYDSFKSFFDGVAVVEQDEQYGLIDRSGNEIVPCIYDKIEDFGNEFEGLLCVLKNEEYGLIKKATGKKVTPLIYKGIDDRVEEGFIKVSKGYEKDKFGFVDTTGKEVIPCIYDIAGYFQEGFVFVGFCIDDKWYCSFIDKTGRNITPFVYGYNDMNGFSEGLAQVRRKEVNEDGKSSYKTGFIDKTGKEVIPFIYGDANDFSEGFALVGKGGKYAYINKKGKEITPFIYDRYSRDFIDGMACVHKKTENEYKRDKYGFIDKKGKEVVPLIYDWAGVYRNGIVAVGKKISINHIYGDKWNCGFIDKKGKVVIPLIYDAVRTFNETEILGVEKKGEWAFVNKNGKEITPFVYNRIYNFVDGLMIPRKAWNACSIIDKTGKETLLPNCYSSADDSFKEGMAYVVKKDGKIGFIDTTGKEVIPCIYNAAPYVPFFSDGLALVEKNGIRGFVDKEGNFIYPGGVEIAKELKQAVE